MKDILDLLFVGPKLSGIFFFKVTLTPGTEIQQIEILSLIAKPF